MGRDWSGPHATDELSVAFSNGGGQQESKLTERSERKVLAFFVNYDDVYAENCSFSCAIFSAYLAIL